MIIQIIKAQFIFLIAFGMLTISDTPKQEKFEKEVGLKNGQTVKLDLKFASQIIVSSWNKSTLYIKAEVEHNFDEPLEFEMQEINSSNRVEIDEKIKNLEKIKNRTFSNKWSDSNCLKLEIHYQVFLPSNTELDINSISGNIEVKNMNNALNLETISGFVDVALDASKKYYFKCSTISGSIYSDLKFDSNEMIKPDIVGSKLNSSINGGGERINLKTISGDVFLRKR